MTQQDDTLFSSTMNEIKELQDFFTTAYAHLQSGEMLDMTGVDKRISSVCQAAQSSPAEQQKAYLPELTALINLLNSYEGELRKIQTSFASEVAKGAGNGDPN